MNYVRTRDGAYESKSAEGRENLADSRGERGGGALVKEVRAGTTKKLSEKIETKCNTW